MEQAVKRDVILYGAGKRAIEAYFEIKNKYNAVCFADKDSSKQGTALLLEGGRSLPVLSFLDACSMYPEALLFITTNPPIKYYVIWEMLNSYGIADERIINYEPVFNGKSCEPLEQMLVFGNNNITACCAKEGAPVREYDDNVSDEQLRELIENFKSDIYEAMNSDSPLSGCGDCKFLKQSIHSKTYHIREINLIAGSMCQFSCVYCANNEEYSQKRQDNLKRVLDYIDYLKAEQLIDKSTFFYIANGEVTINPLRGRIYKTVREFPCVFFTNGEICSKEISEILAMGRSKVNISLDAGTQETFFKVKGKDSFNKVCETVIEYSKYGQVELKYIILPGLNDNPIDALCFVELASQAKATVILSRDSNQTNKFDENIESCLSIASLIIEGAKKNGLPIVNIMNGFTDESEFKQRIDDIFA